MMVFINIYLCHGEPMGVSPNRFSRTFDIPSGVSDHFSATQRGDTRQSSLLYFLPQTCSQLIFQEALTPFIGSPGGPPHHRLTSFSNSTQLAFIPFSIWKQRWFSVTPRIVTAKYHFPIKGSLEKTKTQEQLTSFEWRLIGNINIIRNILRKIWSRISNHYIKVPVV